MWLPGQGGSPGCEGKQCVVVGGEIDAGGAYVPHQSLGARDVRGQTAV